jgi:signal recognition particle subunit SEC65
MEILKLTTEMRMYIVTSKMEKRKLLKEIAKYIKEFLIILA